jgi:hypothetical protein
MGARPLNLMRHGGWLGQGVWRSKRPRVYLYRRGACCPLTADEALTYSETGLLIIDIIQDIRGICAVCSMSCHMSQGQQAANKAVA